VDRKDRGERRLTGERILAMAPSKDDDGESPTIDDGVEYADDVQKRTVNSEMASRSSIASSRGGGRRLEMMQRVGDFRR
jgi:hypothetical protein